LSASGSSGSTAISVRSGTSIGEAFNETAGDLLGAARGDALGSGTNIGEASNETTGNLPGAAGGEASGSGTNIREAFNETAGDLLGAAGGDVLEVHRRYPKYSRLTLLLIPLSPCVVRD
jgi:hypothetical protein